MILPRLRDTPEGSAVSVSPAAPARIKDPLPPDDNVWFAGALAVLAVCVLIEVWRLFVLRDFQDVALRFIDTAPKIVIDGKMVPRPWEPGPLDVYASNPRSALMAREAALESNHLLLSIAFLAAIAVLCVLLGRMNYWYVDAGQPRGYRRLVAFRVLVAAGVAWFLVGFVFPSILSPDPSDTADDVREYVSQSNLGAELRIVLTVVGAWCIYRIWTATQYLPSTDKPIGPGIVDWNAGQDLTSDRRTRGVPVASEGSGRNSQPTPGIVSVPPSRVSMIWFVAVIASQVLYLLVAVRHLVLLNDLSQHAGAFDQSTPQALLVLTERAESVDNNVVAMQVVSVVGLIIFVAWIVQVNRHFTDAGQPRGYRKLLAYRVWQAAVVASLVLAFVLSPGIDTATAQAVRDFTSDATLIIAVRMVLVVVYIWCTYSIWRATRRLT